MSYFRIFNIVLYKLYRALYFINGYLSFAFIYFLSYLLTCHERDNGSRALA